MAELAARARQWASARMLEVGPPELAALLRILIIALLWSRFARPFRVHLVPDLLWLASSLSFWWATLMVGLGVLLRFHTWMLSAVCLWMVFGIGYGTGVEGWTHHHTWLLLSAAALLPFCHAGNAFSVDAWWARRRGQAVQGEVPYWGLRLIAIQVSACYGFGAFDKLSAAYLSGARLQHHFIRQLFGSGVHLDATRVHDVVWAAVATGSVLLEFGLCLGLWWARTRPWLIALGIAFHLSIYLTLPVSTFSATICVLYLAFLSPREATALFTRARGPI